MHESFKKAGRISAWILGVLVGLVVLSVVALQLPVVKGKLLDEITRRVNAVVAGEMRAERLSGPLLWSATLHDVRLRDERGNPVGRADELELNC